MLHTPSLHHIPLGNIYLKKQANKEKSDTCTLFHSIFSQHSHLHRCNIVLELDKKIKTTNLKFEFFKQSLEMPKISITAVTFKHVIPVASSLKSQLTRYIPSHAKLMEKPGNKRTCIYIHSVLCNYKVILLGLGCIDGS